MRCRSWVTIVKNGVTKRLGNSRVGGWGRNSIHWGVRGGCVKGVDVDSGVNEDGLADSNTCFGMRTIMLFEWLDPFFPLVVVTWQR